MIKSNDRKQLMLMNVTNFFNMYIDNHRNTGGLKNVRLCTLETQSATISSDSSEYEKILERMELLMADAPADGSLWDICVWVMHCGSLCPLMSHGSVGKEHIPLTILNHVIAMAKNQYVAAFEVKFYDDNPSHKWLFIA